MSGMGTSLPPGSKEAVDAGCLCAVIDNCYGRGYLGGMVGPDGELLYVVTAGCPLHSPALSVPGAPGGGEQT